MQNASSIDETVQMLVLSRNLLECPLQVTQESSLTKTDAAPVCFATTQILASAKDITSHLNGADRIQIDAFSGDDIFTLAAYDVNMQCQGRSLLHSALCSKLAPESEHKSNVKALADLYAVFVGNVHLHCLQPPIAVLS